MSQKLIDHLVENGATVFEAQSAVDLAKHAVDQAIDRVIGITSAAPSDLIMAASRTIAFRMLHTNIGAVIEEIGK